jgi:hypothetical protein
MHSQHRAARFGIALLLIAAACHHNSTGPNNTTTSYSGRATALVANVTATGTDTALVTAGPLGSTGGALDSAMASGGLTGVVTADALHSSTVGQGSATTSASSLSDLSITVGGHTITAEFVAVNASAVCNGMNPTLTASTVVSSLMVDGSAVAVTGDPNQSVPLTGGGTLTINEQTSTSGSISVTGLHVSITGVADIAVATATASITCGSTCPAPQGDFVTGGGWITVGGSKGTFSVDGGLDGTTPWGALEYQDHGTGLKVHGTGVTAYTVVDAATRSITGNATINGVAGTYTVVVADNGEPSTNDTFSISLSNGYNASGTLGGGNIQLHPKPTNCQ